MNIKLIRTFVPCKEFMTSRQFYLDLGFDITWEGDDLISFGTKKQSFFLQNYYNKDWAENLMLQMYVDDLDDLYQHASALIERYDGTRIRDIFIADYGRTFHLIGPAGELWHMMDASYETKTT